MKNVAFLICFLPGIALAQRLDSFEQAKRVALDEIYYDHPVTFYCGAKINPDKTVTLPIGFETDKYLNRAHRLEWEHVVPAENFGRAFIEWREGDKSCVDHRGNSYKGRKCAEKTNAIFRLMQSDLYNLYPAIGAVNAVRSNKQFTELPGVRDAFGSCAMKIEGKKVEPPDATKGPIARTYLYMQETYAPYFHMNPQMYQMMQAWDRQNPPTEWECRRAERIAQIQKNENPFIQKKCPSVSFNSYPQTHNRGPVFYWPYN